VTTGVRSGIGLTHVTDRIELKHKNNAQKKMDSQQIMEFLLAWQEKMNAETEAIRTETIAIPAETKARHKDDGLPRDGGTSRREERSQPHWTGNMRQQSNERSLQKMPR
jgi:hypothetical protein